jgi:spermidine synthase
LLRFQHKYKILVSIGILSAAIIAFQLALMEILSIVQWYHFAYMVISVALLGFGAAGSLLSLFRQRLLMHIENLLPFLMIMTGIGMALVVDISQLSFIRFDSYLLFAEYNHLGRLLITYILFFIPFFSAALAIGLIFINYAEGIGTIYFANLLGSGAGALLALLLLWFFYSRQLPALISILPLLSGLMIIPKRKNILYVVALVAVAIITWKISNPPQLVLSQFKDLSKALLLPDARITHERTSPYGHIQTISSAALRYAPGLSLTAQNAQTVKTAVFLNGNWFGPLVQRNRSDTDFIFDHATLALPYIMAKRERVLVLQSGTGIDVVYAFSRGAKKVVSVEPNAEILSLLKNELSIDSDSLFYNPLVEIHNLDPRTFLMIDTSHYDNISLPMAGSFGGSTGLNALQEQFVLTKEAIRETWQKLNSTGVISISSWMDYPARYPLKILATMVEVLDDMGIQHPENHIAAIRSWGTASFVMTKSPLQREEILNIRNFCEQMWFDPLVLPRLIPGERVQYNEFQDSSFFQSVDMLFSSARSQLYSGYDFNIEPATDDKPYFSQFIKWGHFKRLATVFGNRLPFFELGYVLVMVTLIQILVVSFVLIALPLFKLGWKGKNRFRVFLYFGGIALGYIFVEIIFIQRFILYFGQPVYSASAVITSLLVFSGFGSYLSAYFQQSARRMWVALSSIVLILFAYSFILTPLLQQTVNAGLAIKLLIIFFLTAPLAFLMGIPFPSGISHLSKTNSLQIPWAWGVNGCISVMSTALATVVAVELGSSWVMVFAALAYCLPLLVWGRILK